MRRAIEMAWIAAALAALPCRRVMRCLRPARRNREGGRRRRRRAHGPRLSQSSSRTTSTRPRGPRRTPGSPDRRPRLRATDRPASRRASPIQSPRRPRHPVGDRVARGPGSCRTRATATPSSAGPRFGALGKSPASPRSCGHRTRCVRPCRPGCARPRRPPRSAWLPEAHAALPDLFLALATTSLRGGGLHGSSAPARLRNAFVGRRGKIPFDVLTTGSPDASFDPR